MAEDENKHLTPVWIVYVDGARLDTDHERLLENGHEQVTVTCSNALHKLSHKTRNASYESRSTSDILKDIINEYSLSPDVDSFGPTRSLPLRPRENSHLKRRK